MRKVMFAYDDWIEAPRRAPVAIERMIVDVDLSRGETCPIPNAELPPSDGHRRRRRTCRTRPTQR